MNIMEIRIGFLKENFDKKKLHKTDVDIENNTKIFIHWLKS